MDTLLARLMKLLLGKARPITAVISSNVENFRRLQQDWQPFTELHRSHEFQPYIPTTNFVLIYGRVCCHLKGCGSDGKHLHVL